MTTKTDFAFRRARFIIFCGMILFVVGCDGYFSASGKYSVKSVSCGLPDSDLVPVFENSFKPFFTNSKCTDCHFTQGSQPGAPFADGDSTIGMNAFIRIGGPEKIQSKLSSNHQGYNYESLKTELESASSQWSAAYNQSCQTEENLTATQKVSFFETEADPETGAFLVREDLESRLETLSWALEGNNFSSDALSNVVVTLQVEIMTDENRVPSYYLVHELRVTTSERLEIQGVSIYLNGQESSGSDAWSGARDLISGEDQLLRGADSPIIIAKDPGEIYSSDDTWSLQFEALEFK